MRNLIYLCIVAMLSSCLPCDRITIENGPIPDSALSFVPYQNGETYKLKHSNGFIINFETTRSTIDGWYRDDRHDCSEPFFDYRFEINTTKLKPDYPIFDCTFDISNRDTTHLDCFASIGSHSFYIPTSDLQLGDFEKVDSLTLNSVLYYNVFKLKLNYSSYYNQNLIYPDSLYYNFQQGILKISMSNGEYYEITR